MDDESTLTQPARRRFLTGKVASAGPLVHVVSFVLRAFPAKLDDVVARIRHRAHFNIVAAQDSRVVVLAELATESDLVEALADLEAIPGVLNAALVYHHAETESSLQELAAHGDPT